jgi:hypothetical protein
MYTLRKRREKMIRFLVGFLILAGAIGADDFAMESGTMPPSFYQTILLSVIGLSIMLIGLSKILEKSEK